MPGSSASPPRSCASPGPPTASNARPASIIGRIIIAIPPLGPLPCLLLQSWSLKSGSSASASSGWCDAVPLPKDCTTSPCPLTQTVLPLTVWQATPPEPAQVRLPFTDRQRSVSAEARTPQETTHKPASNTVREQRDMAASSATG